ncbi:hypothetical protein MAUB_31090 [Mycolicibacterium aubagnense]|uniref:Uncharacterized protein n=1 Tax=Mycolicibacterium aubagnense TaxID=319707 RepID=A0ABM7IF17_9MYCO|nr:hypothetical protein MAUB_31090 [Mycolicibacterium aubagnense]
MSVARSTLFPDLARNEPSLDQDAGTRIESIATQGIYYTDAGGVTGAFQGVVRLV